MRIGSFIPILQLFQMRFYQVQTSGPLARFEELTEKFSQKELFNHSDMKKESTILRSLMKMIIANFLR